MKSVGDQHEVNRSGDKLRQRIGIAFHELAIRRTRGGGFGSCQSEHARIDIDRDNAAVS